MIVATLTVKRSELEAFRQFESMAARVMQRHRGNLERAVFVDEGEGDRVREVHLIRFESAEAFESYRNDPELLKHSELRRRAIVDTVLLMGVPIDY